MPCIAEIVTGYQAAQKARHANSGMTPQQWDEFLLIYKGDVDKSLTGYIAWADGEARRLNGVPPPTGDPNIPLIADDADLAVLPLAPIVAEMLRLERLFSADKLVRDQYAALTARIAQENSALQASRPGLAMRKVLQLGGRSCRRSGTKPTLESSRRSSTSRVRSRISTRR